MIKNREFTPEFKTEVILEVFKNTKCMKDIAVEYEVNYSTVKKWKKEVLLHLPELLGKESIVECEYNKGKLKNRRLKKQLKKKEQELDFLKRKKFLISLLQK